MKCSQCKNEAEPPFHYCERCRERARRYYAARTKKAGKVPEKRKQVDEALQAFEDEERIREG